MTQFYPPGQVINAREGGLGLPVEGQWIPLVVGPSELGAENVLHFFRNGSSEVVSTVGRGSGAELAAALADAGGCMFLKTAASTAGSIGTAAVTRVGTSTGTIAFAGAPNDAYRPRVKIVESGGLGVGRFQFALDGYSTTEAYGWSPIYTIPSGGSFVIPRTGVTATFTAGAGPITFEAGDVHRVDCIAPHYTTADLSSAFAALPAQLGTVRVRRVILTGTNQTASAAVVLAAALAGHLDTLAASFEFARAVMDGGSVDTSANFKTAIASFTDDRVALVYDPQTAAVGCHIVSRVPFAGWTAPRVSFANAVGERIAQTELSESPDRVMSGSLRGVLRIGNDEGISPTFTAEDRIITARKHKGYGGYFITKGFIRSAPTSDFRTLQWGFVIDEMCQIAHDNLEKWLGSNLRAMTDGTGRLSLESAARVESDLRVKLSAALKEPPNIEGDQGHVSDCTYTVLRTNDYLTSGEIIGSGVAVPLREVDGITTSIGFVRSI
jgi:hypothetical protein